MHKRSGTRTVRAIVAAGTLLGSWAISGDFAAPGDFGTPAHAAPAEGASKSQGKKKPSRSEKSAATKTDAHEKQRSVSRDKKKNESTRRSNDGQSAAEHAQNEPLALGPGCVRHELGGSTSCKPAEVWSNYAQNTCARQQLTLDQTQLSNECNGGRFRHVEFSCCPSPDASIPITAGNGLVAAWNSLGREADPSAIEYYRAWGYEIPPRAARCATAPNGRAYAFYYLKSGEDFSDAPGAAQKDPNRPLQGFPNFSAALRRHNRSADELVLQFSTLPLATPAFNGPPEARRYGNGVVGNYRLRLGRNGMVRGSLRQAPLDLTIDYHDPDNCMDDQISGSTGPAPVESDANPGSAAMREIAAAFLQDLNGRRLQLQFDSIQVAVVRNELLRIHGNGRVGTFFNIGSGAIRAVP